MDVQDVQDVQDVHSEWRGLNCYYVQQNGTLVLKAQSDGSIILFESKIQIFDELTRGRIYVVMKKRSAIFLHFDF